MTIKSFAELTKQVHILNDLILTDMICGSADYSEEFLAFSHHLFATKYWFVRISWANKRRYILALLEDVRSTWALSLLLKSLWNCRPKDAVSSAAQPRPWSIYDQVPMDHNRTAMPISTLGQVMTNDRKWFHLLDPESQALVLSELLTIAGGPLMWEVLRRGQTIYERHRDQQLRDLLDCIVVDQTVKSEKETFSEVSPSEHKKDKNNDFPSGLSEIDLSYTSSPHPGTPVSQSQAADLSTAEKNLVASLAAWNSIIKGIQDSQKLEELEMTFTDGTVRKIWKVNRVKPEVIETVDFLQLLPSSIGKRILSFLPRTSLADYAKVNKYWAYLVDELKIELITRAKLDQDKHRFQDLMLKNDISLETIAPSTIMQQGGSIGPSIDPSSRRHFPSYRASERSAGGVSFRHMVVEKLKPAHKIKPKPITKLADLNDRLERRGAADENLWQWCENALKHIKGRHPKAKPNEGVLKCDGVHFPCPLMKHSVELPMSVPLSSDPACPTAGLRKAPRRNFSYPAVNLPCQNDVKRFSLWSRDFSSLYKVFKVASYHSPVFPNKF